MISELPLPKGKAMMLTGSVLVVLGVLALFSPVAAGGTVIKIIGVILALAGLAEFVHAFRTNTRIDTVMSSMLALITFGAAMLMLFDTTAASGFLTIILVVFLSSRACGKYPTPFDFEWSQVGFGCWVQACSRYCWPG